MKDVSATQVFTSQCRACRIALVIGAGRGRAARGSPRVAACA
ncbi:MAG: hypothetical protein AAF761_06295 [Pseudomonadota bacterium]